MIHKQHMFVNNVKMGIIKYKKVIYVVLMIKYIYTLMVNIHVVKLNKMNQIVQCMIINKKYVNYVKVIIQIIMVIVATN